MTYRPNRTTNTLGSLFALFISILLFTADNPCHATELTVVEKLLADTSTADLSEIRKRKQLRALVTYSRSDFTIMPNGRPKGLQVELLAQYEKMLNKGIKREVDKTHIVLIPTSFDRLLPDLAEGRGDIAAALLTITPERKKSLAFASGAAMNVDELVVVNRKVNPINGVEDLAGREIYVLRNSSYAEHLQALNRQLIDKGLKPIRIKQADSHLLSEDILEMVNAGIVSITVVDDYKAKLWAKVLPNIRVLDDVQVKSDNILGWAVRKDNPELHEHLATFAKSVKKGTLLGNILFKRYYANTKWIKNPLAESERSKFRQVIGIFSKYADIYDFDVLAAMAQAYQESQLDHNKRSHRGAVGIMQLLPSTAADPNVEITDISSLDANIHAGVKYLSFLRKRYFSDPQITDEDKMAFSWAAYNAGPANVRRMRNKAHQMGLDPNVWFGNVELAAARIVGRETIQYVRNIFKYYIAYSLVREMLLQESKNYT
ncbi:MAG: transporter substrate-binding domain-containing protein [Gammaproteobacteria bacterium]|nr:transporter substrate-binding domain-containing protein [Gammaproteobacteria bacterium]